VLISFGNVIDEEVNQVAIAIHRELGSQSFEGFVESVPAYSSVGIFYNGEIVKQSNPTCKTAFEFVERYLKNILDKLSLNDLKNINSAIDVPVFYRGEDLGFVAQQHQLTTDEVIALHTGRTYKVFMIGFLPGFAYMGSVDSRLATPRKDSPRKIVPVGSVGIAGFQTGIYPQSSPGGWQLIGQTPIRIFDITKNRPCLFNPGDIVRFHSISESEFAESNEY